MEVRDASGKPGAFFCVRFFVDFSMKNNFLQSLKKEIDDNSVPVTIAGVDLVVRKPTSTQYREWIIQAEEIAKDELEPLRESLQSRNPSESEQSEYMTIARSSGMNTACKSVYDYRLLTRKISILSKRMLTEVLWTPEGGRPWDNDEEREEVVATLASFPGAEELIQSALRSEKKSIAPTKSRKGSGTGPK
jgi:hypothetical protein